MTPATTPETPDPPMQGKTCLITGGSDGIGYAAAHELARMGAQVVIIGRNAAKTDAAIARIAAAAGNPAIDRILADLSSQQEVRRAAAQALERLPRLDVLLNNAGAIFLSQRRSPDGLEMTFALNHLAYFLLTTLLLDRLKASAPARIINVSSSSHWRAGNFPLTDLPDAAKSKGYRAYGRSKLCNILFTYELARRLAGAGVTVNAAHPGLVRTRIARNNGLLGRAVNAIIGARGVAPAQGAATLLYLAASPEAHGITGQYFVDCRPAPSSEASYNTANASRLWELSAELTRQPGLTP